MYFLLATLFYGSLYAQGLTPNDYEKKYSGETFVNLSDIKNIEISLKRKGIYIEEHFYNEYLYLTNLTPSNTSRSIRFTEDFYQIKDVEAITYIPNNGKYKKEKIKGFTRKEVMSDDVFYDGQMAVLYNLPSLQKNSRTSLAYTRVVKDPKFLGAAFFQNTIITGKQVLEIKVDADVSMDIQYRNCNEGDFTYTKVHNSKETTYRWEQNDIPKLDMESSSPSIQSIAPQILYRINHYKLNGEQIKVLSNVKDLYSWYSSLVQDAYLDENEEIIALVEDITKNLATQTDKAKAIFQWVQKNIKYIAVEDGLGGFKPRNPSTTFKNRYGDCKDMSSLLVNMLNTSGLEGRYTWIGTRDLPYKYADVPTPMSDNHMIAAVKLDGEYVFLDATSSEVPFYYPTKFIQGKEALIYCSKDSFEIAEVTPVIASKNHNHENFEIHLSNGNIEGNGSSQLNGYHAEHYNNRMNSTMDKKEKRKFFEALTYKGNNKYQLKSFFNDTAYADIASLNYTFSLPNYYFNDGTNIFINLNLERPFADADLKETRKMPLEQSFKGVVSREVTLNIPDGYTIDYLPKNSNYHNDLFSYSIVYEQVNPKQITYALNVTTNFLVLDPQYFSEWNTMINTLKKDYNESILLKQL